MKLLLAASIVFVLGACATPDSADKSQDKSPAKSPSKYAGAPEQALIAGWGPPSSVDEADGTRYLSYRQHRASYIPAATPFYQPICSPSECVPLGGAKGFMLNEQCITTFAIEDGKVKGWRREGKACGA